MILGINMGIQTCKLIGALISLLACSSTSSGPKQCDLTGQNVCDEDIFLS